MSRHTLNDGVTPDKEIVPGSFDEWWFCLAPPASLLGDYYKRSLPWKRFEERFIFHLSIPEIHAELQALVKLAMKSDVTILCVEKTPEQCHRRLIAEASKRINPRLSVIIE